MPCLAMLKDPEADNFQNLISAYLTTAAVSVKFSLRCNQQFLHKVLTDRQTDRQTDRKAPDITGRKYDKQILRKQVLLSL